MHGPLGRDYFCLYTFEKYVSSTKYDSDTDLNAADGSLAEHGGGFIKAAQSTEGEVELAQGGGGS